MQASSNTSKANGSHRRLRHWLVGLALGFVAVLVALGGAAMWTLKSEGGQRWLLAHVPGLQAEGVQGRADGGPFSVARLRWSSASMRVTVEDLAWQDARWRWHPFGGTWVGIALSSPSARKVTIVPLPHAQPEPQAPAEPPKNLRLPIALALKALRVEAVQWAEAPWVRNVAGDIEVGANEGQLHRGSLQADVDAWHVAADVRVAAGGAMALDGHVQALQAAASAPWRGEATLRGTVSQPEVGASLAQGGQNVLQAQASLRPFQAQMLASLEASTSGLDLAGLVPGAPSTKLSGSAKVHATGAGGPLQATVLMENAVPGRWDAARLPLQRVQLTADIAAPQDIQLRACDAWLHGGRPAGQLSCSGQWHDGALNLKLRLQGVRADELHSAAPLMTLSGELNTSLDEAGAASPSPQRADSASTPRAGGATNGSPVHATLEAALSGTLHGVPSGKDTVEIQGKADFNGRRAPDGGFSRWAADVPRLDVQAGAASLHAQASLNGDAPGAWQVRTQGRMRAFDPSVWWAGPSGARLRHRRHDLNAEWDADLKIARDTATKATLALSSVAGKAHIDVLPSMLAGVPVSAKADVDAAGGALDVQARSDLAGNTLQAHVHWPTSAAQAPSWSASIQAPGLQTLSPWRDVLPSVSTWVPTAGQLEGELTGSGRFPDLAVSGALTASKIQSPQWGVSALDATWRAHLLQPRAPVMLQLQASAAHYGDWSAPSLTAQVNGSMASHRLTASGTVVQVVRAAAKESTAQGTPAPPGRDAFELALAGTWSGHTGCDGTWHASISELRAWNAAAGHTNDPPWLQARGLDTRVALAPSCGLQAASLAPGQLQALGASLRWSEAQLSRGTHGALQGSLQAQVMPMAIAPLLARLQPERGWRGDLRLAARASLRLSGKLSGDVVIERTQGDLGLLTSAGDMSLGLQSLRIAATSQGDAWHLSENLVGHTIGTLDGSQTITLSDGPLPTAASSLAGHLSLQAPQLAVWSAFLPAPWQLRGNVRGQANFSGTLGAPVLAGGVQGTDLAVRNVLQGIDLNEGSLRVTLQGQQAVLERLAFKGGDGRVTATGRATFGATPVAQIDVRAERLKLLGRVDRLVVVSGQAGAVLNGDRMRVDGRFNVDKGLIDISTSEAPSLDEDVVLHKNGRVVDVDGRPVRVETEGESSPLMQQAEVSVWVGLGDDLRLRGKGLDTLLKGQLHVTTPGGELTVNGTVRTEGGRYTAYGQNLIIDRGIIQFDGPLATPRLDILALRADVDIRVGVAINGNAADPRVRLYSEPDMSDTDKLSWLVMGRAPEGLGQEDIALLQRAALALAAGQKGKPAGGGLVKRLGLDELSLSQGESGDLRGTVVSLGKQLSEHWRVSYEQGLNATVGSWRLIYRLARQLDFRLTTGAESAVDVVRTWRFN